MWSMIAALTISLVPVPLAPPGGPPPLAPYVACRDGYIAPTLDDCPETRVKPPHNQVPLGGGGGRRGLLGLGGLGGIL
jgi:hypothetical protein